MTRAEAAEATRLYAGNDIDIELLTLLSSPYASYKITFAIEGTTAPTRHAPYGTKHNLVSSHSAARLQDEVRQFILRRSIEDCHARINERNRRLAQLGMAKSDPNA